jgi:hypothetical protein
LREKRIEAAYRAATGGYTPGMNDPDNPMVLANLRTDAEAAMLVAHLETIGITARISGTGGSTGWPEAAGYTQVVVRQADLERAQAAVDQQRAAHPPTD